MIVSACAPVLEGNWCRLYILGLMSNQAPNPIVVIVELSPLLLQAKYSRVDARVQYLVLAMMQIHTGTYTYGVWQNLIMKKTN